MHETPRGDVARKEPLHSCRSTRYDHVVSDLNASEGREPKPAVARHDDIGPKLRLARTKQGRGLRELASRLEISPSALSQIELGRSMPSVRSLYSIVSELNISLDQLLGEDESRGAQAFAQGQASERAVVTRSSERMRLDLDSGAHWERLSPAGERNIDFLAATYDVGGASGPAGMFTRHPGRELTDSSCAAGSRSPWRLRSMSSLPETASALTRRSHTDWRRSAANRPTRSGSLSADPDQTPGAARANTIAPAAHPKPATRRRRRGNAT